MATKSDRPKGPVTCLCTHCGEIYGANAGGQCALYCKDCRTAEGRKKIDAENAKIREEARARE